MTAIAGVRCAVAVFARPTVQQALSAVEISQPCAGQTAGRINFIAGITSGVAWRAHSRSFFLKKTDRTAILTGL